MEISGKLHIKQDTLYVLDKKLERVSLFNIQTGNLVRTITIPNAKIDDVSLGSAQNIFPLQNGNMLIYFLNPNIFPPKQGQPAKMITVAKVNRVGDFIQKNVLRLPTPYPSQQKIIYFKEAISVFAGLAFYPVVQMETDAGGHFYVAGSDSLLFRKYNVKGALENKIQTAYSPHKLTDAYMDSLPMAKAKNFNKAINQAGQPAYWPAFKSFFISDKGRLWVHLLNLDNTQGIWWIFTADGNPKWKLKLPPRVTLFDIQQNKAYGISSPDSGMAALVRYSLQDF